MKDNSQRQHYSRPHSPDKATDTVRDNTRQEVQRVEGVSYKGATEAIGGSREEGVVQVVQTAAHRRGKSLLKTAEWINMWRSSLLANGCSCVPALFKASDAKVALKL